MIYFLAAYAHINVTQKLDAAITVAFRPAMSSIFELVTKEDLDLANSIMDGPSRSFIRVLYADYKKQGKWTDDM
jgi:nucleolar pre-ribosomal-associated protein 2